MKQTATLATRAAVRGVLTEVRDRADAGSPLVLVGLSGGADSLALAAAAAFEAPRGRVRAGAVVVDHGLQPGSAEVAARAARQARALGLDPVLVRRVAVPAGGGPEGAAREARYGAFARAVRETGAAAILTAHTRDDQAEQVLLALARGSGTRSLAGIPPERELAAGAAILRPFLAPAPGITRAITAAACDEQGLDAWRDPHNGDHAFARVRVRERALPTLERELGPGIAAALARTADLAREDADALDAAAARAVESWIPHRARDPEPPPLADPDPDPDPGPGPGPGPTHLPAIFAETARSSRSFGAESAENDGEWRPPRPPGGAKPVLVPVAALADEPAAIRNRVIRLIANRCFGSHLAREHTLAIAALVTDWHGQGPVFVPGLSATRSAGVIRFEARRESPRAASGTS